MSYADNVFIDMCRDIIENGYSTEGEKVRPKWEDGTYAYTVKRFGVVNRYDLSKEFPAITLRKTYIKSAIEADRNYTASDYEKLNSTLVSYEEEIRKLKEQFKARREKWREESEKNFKRKLENVDVLDFR